MNIELFLFIVIVQSPNVSRRKILAFGGFEPRTVVTQHLPLEPPVPKVAKSYKWGDKCSCSSSAAKK